MTTEDRNAPRIQGMPAPRAKRPRVALLNELGGGMGHMHALAHIAGALGKSGFDCEIAVPDPRAVPARLKAKKLRLTLWPVPEKSAGPPGKYAGSYADILALIGFDDRPRVAAAIAAAEKRLSELKPDLIVADFAPVAMLAAAGRIPVLWTGHSYSIPPLDGPRFDRFRQDDVMAVDEDRLTEILQGVQAPRGAPYFSDLPAAFAHTKQIVCCSEVADIFAASRMAPVQGYLVRHEPLPLEARTERIVAYLHGQHHSLAQILDALAASKRDVLLYLAKAPGWAEARVAGSQIVFSPEPLVFPNDLARAGLLVHAGGANLTEEALSLGLPQVTFPMQIEQHMLGLMLRRYGLVEVLGPGFTQSDFRHAIATVLSSDARLRVRLAAERIKREKPDGALPALLAAATSLVS